MFNFLENIPDAIQVFLLYKKYEKYFHDDYTSRMDFCSFLKFIKESAFFRVIFYEPSGEFAGFVYLDNFTGTKKNLHSAEVTGCMKMDFWGVRTFVCAMEFFDYAFETLHLNKIKAQIYPENSRVKTLLKRCGFKKEGYLKDETLRNGKFQDIEVYALARKERKNENRNR